MEEAHQGVAGGHFAADIRARKIMLTGYWWPTLFKDCALFVRGCAKMLQTREERLYAPAPHSSEQTI